MAFYMDNQLQPIQGQDLNFIEQVRAGRFIPRESSTYLVDLEGKFTYDAHTEVFTQVRVPINPQQFPAPPPRLNNRDVTYSNPWNKPHMPRTFDGLHQLPMTYYTRATSEIERVELVRENEIWEKAVWKIVPRDPFTRPFYAYLPSVKFVYKGPYGFFICEDEDKEIGDWCLETVASPSFFKELQPVDSDPNMLFVHVDIDRSRKNLPLDQEFPAKNFQRTPTGILFRPRVLWGTFYMIPWDVQLATGQWTSPVQLSVPNAMMRIYDIFSDRNPLDGRIQLYCTQSVDYKPCTRPPPAQGQPGPSTIPPPAQGRPGPSTVPPPAQGRPGPSTVPPPAQGRPGPSTIPPPAQGRPGPSTVPLPEQGQPGPSEDLSRMWSGTTMVQSSSQESSAPAVGSGKGKQPVKACPGCDHPDHKIASKRV